MNDFEREEFYRCHEADFPRPRTGAIILILFGAACGIHAALLVVNRVVMICNGILDLLVGLYSYKMSLGNKNEEWRKFGYQYRIVSWAHDRSLGLSCYWFGTVYMIIASAILLALGRMYFNGIEAIPALNACVTIMAVLGIAAARNRYRLLTDEQIISSGYFGKIRMHDARAIYRLCRNMSGDTRVIEETGRTLIHYETNMENSEAFTKAIIQYSQKTRMETGRPEPKNVLVEKGSFVTRQVSEDLDKVQLTYEREKKVQTIRALLWGQTIGSVYLVVMIFFFMNSEIFAISTKAFFGIVQILTMLPLLYPMFFPDIVKWTDPSSGRFANRTQRRNEDKWKQAYVSIIMPATVSALMEIIAVVYPLQLRFNIMKGSMVVWITGILMFALYLAILNWRTHLRISSLLFCVLLSSLSIVGGTMSLFYCTAAKPVHVLTTVEDLHTTHSSRDETSYYATVTLPDETSRQIELFKSTYEAAEQGEKMDLCIKESILGVEIFMVHEHEE